MKEAQEDIYLTSQIEELQKEAQIKELQKKVREAEGELSIIKGIGQNSPEMKTLKAENEELKAALARSKEDHQYDNLVHQRELESLKNPIHDLRKKGLM